MGYSLTKAVSDVLDIWMKRCLESTNCQNVYMVGSEKYFWETGRRVNDDDSVTGSIWRFVGENVRRSGTFRIEANGTITRAPKFLRV